MRKRMLFLTLLITVFLLAGCIDFDIFNSKPPIDDDTSLPDVDDNNSGNDNDKDNDNDNDNDNDKDNDNDEDKDTEYAYLKSKILSIDTNNKTIDFLNFGKYSYGQDLRIYQRIQDRVDEISIADLYVGLENVYLEYVEETNKITRVLLDGEIGFRNIRVAIRQDIADISDNSKLFHYSASFTLGSSGRIYTIDNEHSYNIKANQFVQFQAKGENVHMYIDNKEVFNTKERIIIDPSNPTSKTTFNSIRRSFGIPSYYGLFEIVPLQRKLMVINDVDIEKYLENVVPSEMPSSFHLEALKAQAIAARTYAYRDIFNKENDELGYAVDDSEMSQVYNNQISNPITNQAITATANRVMVENGRPIPIYYSSSSAGITASAHEVWLTEPTLPDEITALLGQNLTTDENGNIVDFDHTDEASMLAFFKRIKVNTPEPNSTKFHRWKLTLTANEIKNSISKTLPNMYEQYPQLILTKVGDEFVSQPITADVGNVLDLNVAIRGESGVVIALDIITTKTTYRIYNQYNIRFTLRPGRDYTNSTNSIYYTNYNRTGYGPSETPPGILNSGFFAIEKGNQSFTFYGGGNGHGVGMSQYGANGFAHSGQDYAAILKSYFYNANLESFQYVYYAVYDIPRLFADIQR